MGIRSNANPALGGSPSAILLAGALACGGFAQTPVSPLPKPDADGWIKLYRGANSADFSVFTGSGALTGSSRSAVLGMIGFFVAGGWLLSRVDVEAGERAARAG